MKVGNKPSLCWGPCEPQFSHLSNGHNNTWEHRIVDRAKCVCKAQSLVDVETFRNSVSWVLLVQIVAFLPHFQ